MPHQKEVADTNIIGCYLDPEGWYSHWLLSCNEHVDTDCKPHQEKFHDLVGSQEVILIAAARLTRRAGLQSWSPRHPLQFQNPRPAQYPVPPVRDPVLEIPKAKTDLPVE